jgi:hypothetical protein
LPLSVSSSPRQLSLEERILLFGLGGDHQLRIARLHQASQKGKEEQRCGQTLIKLFWFLIKETL